MSKQALASVKEMENIEEMWTRLKNNFGDPQIMLKQKMTVIYRTANIGLKKSAAEVRDSFVTLVNCITRLA